MVYILTRSQDTPSNLGPPGIKHRLSPDYVQASWGVLRPPQASPDQDGLFLLELLSKPRIWGCIQCLGAIVIIFLEHSRNTCFNVTHFQVQLIIFQGFLQDYWSQAALDCKKRGLRWSGVAWDCTF